MRIVTHQFAHVETLDRAKRWLVQADSMPPGSRHTRREFPGSRYPSNQVRRPRSSGSSTRRNRQIPKATPASGRWPTRTTAIRPSSIIPARWPAAHSLSRLSSGGGPKTPSSRITQTDTEANLQKAYRDGKD